MATGAVAGFMGDLDTTEEDSCDDYSYWLDQEVLR
jgi:hypothetical protein